MRAFITLCLVAMAVGLPLNEEIKESQNINIKQQQGETSNHLQKREVVVKSDADADDCSELDGEAFEACVEKRVKRNADPAMMSDDDGQDVNGTAHQDSDIQEAWSNEGAYARQGEGGQFVSASDFGGPIVQILQHVYKANCCACGCNCGCEGEGGDMPDDHDDHDADTTAGSG